MSVIIGKILWLLLSPGSVLFGLLMLSIALSLPARTRKWGRRLGAAMLVLVVVIGMLPLHDWLLRPLEDYFPQPELPARIDGIVVLSGAEVAGIGSARNQPEVNSSADRLLAFADLARRYPEARLVYTGGGVHFREIPWTEVDIATRVFAMLGLDPDRVLIDGKSRNTVENAINARALAQPKAGERWLLVTSASHMPRAVNCFQAVDWQVLPYPVDYSTGLPPVFGFAPMGNLGVLNHATKEWVGPLAYRLMGHTRRILPVRPHAA